MPNPWFFFNALEHKTPVGFIFFMPYGPMFPMQNRILFTVHIIQQDHEICFTVYNTFHVVQQDTEAT